MTDLVLMLGDLKLVVPVSELKKMMEQQKAKPVVVAKAPAKASSPTQPDLPLDNVPLVRFRKNSKQDFYGRIIQSLRPNTSTFQPADLSMDTKKIILNAASRLRKRGVNIKVEVSKGTCNDTVGYYISRIS